jgi:hypothetical protein
VIDEIGPKPANVHRHGFETYFRAPRQFYFEFDMDPRAGGERIVVWCDGGDFQSWLSRASRSEAGSERDAAITATQ